MLSHHVRDAALGPRSILALGALAVVPRLWGLGTYSMWLDEVLQTRQAEGSLAETWRALAADAVHPPLDGLLTWALLELGLSESVRRLLPIALGTATVVFLARWTAARFGRTAGLAAGVLAALSPLHVHYSQELRPYALGLFFGVWALGRYEVLLRTPGRRNALFLGLACLGLLASFYFAALFLVPIAILLLGDAGSTTPTLRWRARRLLRLSPLFLLALAAACSPWLGVTRSLGERSIELGAQDWTPALAGERWQYLTVGGVEGRPLAWGGVFALGVVLVGALAGLRSVAGRAAVAGAVAGTVGVELLLQLADHWTNGRYNLVAWPFLTVLAALGVDALAGRRPRPWWRTAATAAAFGSLVAAQLAGLAEESRHARPQWARAAQAVASLHRPGEPIFAVNRWTEICLGYYLEKLPAGESPALSGMGDDPAVILARRDPGACALVAAGGYGVPAGLESRLERQAVRRWRFAGARLYLLGAPTLGASTGEGACRERYLPRELRMPPPATRLLGPRRPRESRLLEFEPATTAEALLYGWSGFETLPDGSTFVWATGPGAALGLHLERPRPLRLRLELWPYAALDAQRLAVGLNGAPLGERALAPGRQTIELVAPATLWRPGENVLAFRFAAAAAPAELDPDARDRRRLAVAFDRLTLIAARE